MERTLAPETTCCRNVGRSRTYFVRYFAAGFDICFNSAVPSFTTRVAMLAYAYRPASKPLHSQSICKQFKSFSAPEGNRSVFTEWASRQLPTEAGSSFSTVSMSQASEGGMCTCKYVCPSVCCVIVGLQSMIHDGGSVACKRLICQEMHAWTH